VQAFRLQPDSNAQIPQEIDTLFLAVKQCQRNFSIGNLQRDARKTGAGPDINYSGPFQPFYLKKREAVQKMPGYDLFFTVDSRQIHLIIPFCQQTTVFGKLPDLRFGRLSPNLRLFRISNLRSLTQAPPL
jgi:hypothetical protein